MIVLKSLLEIVSEKWMSILSIKGYTLSNYFILISYYYHIIIILLSYYHHIIIILLFYFV
jgi:hypothetical protein